MTKKINVKKTIEKAFTSKFIRTCHDEDCPKCGFPETIVIRNSKTFKPISIECTLRVRGKCDWHKRLKT